jgi:hydroxyethylthiazole kinase-like sugar kinase family protein
MSERTYGGQTAAQWRGSVWCSEVMREMLHHIDELQADLVTASKGYAARVRELEAHVAAQRAALEGAASIIPAGMQIWVNDGRDTWEFSSGNPYLNDAEADEWCMVSDVHAALSATPEQSLAALRNEAAAEARRLREAANG